MDMKKLILQLIKFGFVGIIAAIIDVGVLVVLREILHIDVILASAISFTASVIVNYILSMKFVFKSKNQNKTNEFIIFVLLSIGGLIINQLIMWVGVRKFSAYYLYVKIFAMVFVPVYNFITRKIFIESRQN